MPQRRLFVAVEVPAAAVAVATAAAVPYLGLPSARPVAAGLHHVTVRFLGSVPETEVGDVERAVAAAATASAPGTVRLGGLGTFPGAPRPASVLWAAVVPGEPLAALAGRLRGLPGDDRPFHPHVTLARFDPPARLADLPEGPFGDPFPVAAACLFRSLSGEGGPRYDLLGRFPLGG